MCKCNMELISHVDNFSCLFDFGCTKEFVNSLKGIDDEGYLYRCSECGKFEYVSDIMHDINVNIDEYNTSVKMLKQEQQELLTEYLMHEDITNLLQSDGIEDIENFLNINGKLIVNIKDWNDDNIFIFQLRDSFANKFVYWKYVKDHFGKIKVYEISKE